MHRPAFSFITVTAGSLILASVFLLSACHKNDKPPVNLLEAQRKQLEKARQVEGTLQKAADAQRSAIDVETGAAASAAAAK